MLNLILYGLLKRGNNMTGKMTIIYDGLGNVMVDLGEGWKYYFIEETHDIPKCLDEILEKKQPKYLRED